ncbi:hypothetical protein E2562_014927 [Oryza meyeriana var. granulata]|uniref:Uncharacterized protein n=1 Tax=Oryza meyeriana var. granulata TaxID=110450 RepID=A0A6G1EJ49_9ORYZ|nr:hypothetical protein E2562_014927 [Oryza meyeriana var. granulata]KAF0924827.1 hypothetical protein E2562_014927 [Oryza meyeriana var. granulata]KAF0924828.1 hypothetical protein E2562_014927 [Oryza meyeriana var. granulata]
MQLGKMRFRQSDVVVIKVGAAIETELEDRQLRIEDAKNATFTTIEEGIVPGGSKAYVHMSTVVHTIKETIEDSNERLGADNIQKVTFTYLSMDLHWLLAKRGTECTLQTTGRTISTAIGICCRPRELCA